MSNVLPFDYLVESLRFSPIGGCRSFELAGLISKRIDRLLGNSEILNSIQLTSTRSDLRDQTSTPLARPG